MSGPRARGAEGAATAAGAWAWPRGAAAGLQDTNPKKGAGRRWAWGVGLALAAVACQPPPPPAPVTPPAEASLSLAEATAGLGEGSLRVALSVDTGTITLGLDERRAPRAVANFVGLARGLRFFQDPKTGAWVKRPFYDGLKIHRGVPGFLIQGGCPRGDGRGGPGYSFTASPGPKRRHDRAGVLSMVNPGDGRFGSQWLITAGPQPQLDGQQLAFGEVLAGQHMLSRLATQVKRGQQVTIRAMKVYRGRRLHAEANQDTPAGR